MSNEALIAELERQREFARQCFAYFDALLEGRGALLERPPDFNKITGPIKAVLATHPVFGPGRNIFFAQKQLNLYPFFVTQGLLRVMLTTDAPSAVAWLHRLFEVDCAGLRMVAAVHGLEVQEPVSLGNGVRLLPLTAAPDSPNLRSLARQYQGIPSSVMDIAWAMPPTIAVFDMGTVAASTDHMAGKAANDRAYDALLDAARAFTLTDHGAPVVSTSWTDFVEPELTVAEWGQMRTGARFEGSVTFPPLKVDGEALAWAERYLRIDEQLRPSVDVALDRLNLARRRRSPGDQAIDGSICLEALLLERDDSQELTHKLSLRAALLVGTTLSEREEIRKAVRAFYRLRSGVVHGRARRPEDNAPDAQCASRGLEICTQAVRAIVQRNARPDFATWELTGGSPPADAQVTEH
jgi:hypothetical protein